MLLLIAHAILLGSRVSTDHVDVQAVHTDTHTNVQTGHTDTHTNVQTGHIDTHTNTNVHTHTNTQTRTFTQTDILSLSPLPRHLILPFIRAYAHAHATLRPHLTLIDRLVGRTLAEKREQQAHYHSMRMLGCNAKRRGRYAFRSVGGCNELVSVLLSVMSLVVNVVCYACLSYPAGRVSRTGQGNDVMSRKKADRMARTAIDDVISMAKTGPVGQSTNTGKTAIDDVISMAKTGPVGQSTNTGPVNPSINTGPVGQSVNTGKTAKTTNTANVMSAEMGRIVLHKHTSHPDSHTACPFITTYLRHVSVQFVLNTLTFMSSTLLHTHDTPLFKQCDYFCVLLTLIHYHYMLVIKIARLYGIHLSFLLVFHAMTAYHVLGVLFSMRLFEPLLFKRVCAMAIVLVTACQACEYVMVWNGVIGWFIGLSMAGMVVEAMDVPPVMYVVDSHAVWHGIVVVQTVLFYKYVENDMAMIADHATAMDVRM